MTYFVDTNYFLSYFISRNISQQLLVSKLFKKASQGKVKLFTSVLVIFEVYWTLRSFYKLPFSVVKQTIVKITQLSFIGIAEKDLLIQSLVLFTSYSVGLEDCYNFVYAKHNQASSIATFDKKLKSSFTKLKSKK